MTPNRTSFKRVMIGALKSLLVGVVCLAPGLASTAAEPVVSDQLAQEISEAFHYSPLPSEPPVDDPAPTPTDGTVTLDKVVVTHYNATHALELDMAEQAGKIRDEASFWKSGVTFFKHEGPRVTTELKLKFDANHGGWDVLNFSW